MLKNYFKIAIAVLKRRKFFTFISLFGISFSLTILIIMVAFIDNEIRDGYPDYNRSNNLYIKDVSLRNTKEHNSWNGGGSFYFLDHYTKLLKTPVKVAISSRRSATNTYLNNKKYVIAEKFANAAYWDVLHYEFLEGKPFTSQQIENGDHVAVISETIKKAFFGDEPSVIGKYVETDNVQYKVTGVVRDVDETNVLVYSDIYLPYTVSKDDYNDKSFIGNYDAILKPASPADISKITGEFEQIIARIPKPEGWDLLAAHLDSYMATFTRELLGGNQRENSGVGRFFIVATIFLLLFLLLPTLNLVNINISRIMERSSEIGVRKAYGASSRVLVMQFIIENLILTFLGGVIAIILSFIVLSILNNSEMQVNSPLHVNYFVLTCAILFSIVFGLLSGVYPAWRMSRMQAVDALKQG
jgi:putative ABC transport system permease protein